MIRAAIIAVAVAASTAAAEPRDFWLWAYDGRFEDSPSPCSDAKRANPARQAVYDFIGTGTPSRAMVSYVRVDGDRLDMIRGGDGVVDPPSKRLVDQNGIPMSIWYRGSRTWIVTLYVPPKTSAATALASPAFVSVTLVMEANKKREGKPVCHERWIGAVSP